jgi:hypothetical protein
LCVALFHSFLDKADEDIPASESSNASTDPNQAPKTPMHGPITRNHAKKIQQEVHSLLTKIDYNANENFILPKYCWLCLMRSNWHGTKR